MKKIISTIILAFLLGTLANAQDVITLRNGDQIKAKITEISQTELRYKRFEHLDGPTRIVALSEVFAINYENGTRDVINPLTATDAAPVVKPQANQARTQTTNTANERTLGIQAGINIPNSRFLSSLGSRFGDHYIKGKTGFQIGLVTNMPLKNSKFDFQTTISFFRSNIEYGYTGRLPWKNEYNLSFLHSRGDILYKLGKNNTTLLLHAGLIAGIPLHYKEKHDGKIVESRFVFFTGNYDLGIGFGATLAINKIRLGMGYDFGILYNNFSLNLTYILGK